MVIVCSKELAATYEMVTVCFFRAGSCCFFLGRVPGISLVLLSRFLGVSSFCFFSRSIRNNWERCEPDLCFGKRMNPSRDAGIKDGVSRRERRTGSRNAARRIDKCLFLCLLDACVQYVSPRKRGLFIREETGYGM